MDTLVTASIGHSFVTMTIFMLFWLNTPLFAALLIHSTGRDRCRSVQNRDPLAFFVSCSPYLKELPISDFSQLFIFHRATSHTLQARKIATMDVPSTVTALPQPPVKTTTDRGNTPPTQMTTSDDSGRAESTSATSTLAELQSEVSLIVPQAGPERHLQRLLLKRDYRAGLPSCIRRFTGYRPPSEKPLHHHPLPFPPFTWISRLPIRHEIWVYATIGAFTAILLLEAITTTSTAFRDAYHAPIIVGSFGASAVLVFGVTESPLAQPRNAILGQVVSAIISVAITKLWCLTNPGYASHLENRDFYAPGFVNGALCMALALLAQMFLGVVHPPGGATALAGATDPVIVAMSWHYVPVVLASALLMTGAGMLFNNLGKRRYPTYWWAAGRTFVRDPAKVEKPKDVEAA